MIEARLSVNLNALTIEQVIAKRKLILDMSDSLPLEVHASLAVRAGAHLTSDGEPIRCYLTQAVLDPMSTATTSPTGAR